MPQAQAQTKIDKRTWTPRAFAEGDAPAERTSVMVGLFLRPDQAAALALPNGQPPESLHLTLCVLDAEAPQLDDVQQAKLLTLADDLAAWTAPLAGEITGIGRFYAGEGGDGQDAIVALPNIAGLLGLCDDLRERLGFAGLAVADDYEFQPHITLAYVESGADWPADAIATLPLNFDALTVCLGDKQTAIPFRGYFGGLSCYAELAAIAATRPESHFRLFNEATFAEPPATIPILPKPGTYTHPVYGDIVMTPERAANFVANHNARVYQQNVPVLIDIEHDLKGFGAVGYLGDMFVEADGSVSAYSNWTDRGKELIEADAFKYVSPEWWDVWQSPTGQIYDDIISGVAICTNPYFKDDALRPLVASEGRLLPITPARFADTDLPDTCFAYVPDSAKGTNGAKSDRKLKLCNDAGSFDAAIVGAAAAAIGPSGYRGQKVDIPAADRPDVVAKVRAAWKKANPDRPKEDMPDSIKATEVKRMADSMMPGMDNAGTMTDGNGTEYPTYEAWCAGRMPGEDTSMGAYASALKAAHKKQGDPSMADQNQQTTTDQANPEAMTASEKKFAALLATEREQREAAEGQVKTLTERIDKMDRDALVKSFTDEVRGKSDANGVPYVGDPQYHVEMLELLPADKRQAYMERERKIANATRAKDAGFFDVAGSDADGVVASGDGAANKLMARAAALVAEGKAKDFGEAMAQLERIEPRLFAEYQRQPTVGLRPRAE